MSETSSDTESSCEWTIISHEGSDIETMGSEENEAKLLEHPAVEETKPQGSPSDAVCVESAADSVDDTLGERTTEDLLFIAEVTDIAVKEQALSSSELSDIVTLGDVKEDEIAEVEEELATNEEFYLGISNSSQYIFNAADTVFPAQQPVTTNSSSSEDEAGRSSGIFIRKRRQRKSTTSAVTDPEEEEALLDSPPSEEEVGEEKEQAEVTEFKPTAAVDVQEESGWRKFLLTYILLTLLVASCLAFGHFYSTLMKHERPEPEFICGDDFDDVVIFGENTISPVLTEKVEKDNQEINMEQLLIPEDDLEMLQQQETKERITIMSEEQKLTMENKVLKSSLQHEEKSLSNLQEELRNLRAKIRDLEMMGAGTDSLLSENQRLKEQLEKEKQTIRDFHEQRETMMAEAQTLRKKLDKERKVADELRRELNLLRNHFAGAEKEASSEAEELQSRLLDLEKRLSFEQQRSDLFERLYVETKEERAKGDTESRVKKRREGMTGKVKETFDAVKNSTKEFVHHHKEQIKKAKEAVKENFRKFSDSVKSTFQHFKDSASTFFNRAQGFYKKGSNKKTLRSHHSSSQRGHNTRKSGDKVHEDQRKNSRSEKPNMRHCLGVFDCAYQESMSLFNKAVEPIRADEFYQLLHSYLQQQVDHFNHWKPVEVFISRFFHNGLFIHDQMLFTDFVSWVEVFLADMHKPYGLDDDVFEDLDDYVYRHFFGEAYTKSHGPRGPFEKPDTNSKEDLRAKHQQRKQQRMRSRAPCERKWSRSQRNADRHMADVKIELGPMPFDPKY
ncbi:cell cycle progression protein 1 isoform 2-T3 [Pholidichthys leucotaenia]